MSTREAMQDALEMIESLLCDPEGRACVGSDGDCRIIDATKVTLRAALAAEPTTTAPRDPFTAGISYPDTLPP